MRDTSYSLHLKFYQANKSSNGFEWYVPTVMVGKIVQVCGCGCYSFYTTMISSGEQNYNYEKMNLP